MCAPRHVCCLSKGVCLRYCALPQWICFAPQRGHSVVCLLWGLWLCHVIPNLRLQTSLSPPCLRARRVCSSNRNEIWLQLHVFAIQVYDMMSLDLALCFSVMEFKTGLPFFFFSHSHVLQQSDAQAFFQFQGTLLKLDCEPSST